MGELYYSLINYAMAKGIAVQQVPLSPSQRPFSDTESGIVVINSNWPERREMAFQLAHEISHVLNGDDGIYYYSTDRSAQICEGDANRRALHIVIPMYFADIEAEDVNLQRFMDDLQIPRWLEHEAHDIIADFYAA